MANSDGRTDLPDFRPDVKTARTSAVHADLSMSDGDWPSEEKPERDWKKLALVVGLGTLSWVATYIGMLELIESNMGDLPLMHKVVIGFSVAMLMTMIVWLLDQIFAPVPLMTKLTYVVGYVFLTIISVGFGFGFYWKVLESRSESARSAESAVAQVQSALHAASTRMSQLSATLEQLDEISRQKAELERTKGASCPNSRPGDGPRRKLRDEDAQRFGFAAEFVKSRVAGVNGDLSGLDGDLAKIASNDASIVDPKSGTRNEFLKTLGRKLDLTVTGFNAFRTDPQLRQLRADLAERADKTIFPDSRGGTFTCPDPQLQQALKGVVRAIDQLPDLEKPKIAAVEGPEATIEAFRRLTATIYGLLSFKMPPSADELRELQKKAVQSVEASPALQKALAGDQAAGLSKRDYIPLAIALFVDLCLLLVSMGRPVNRLGSLVPKMRAAERGPVIQILSRFNDIHRDDEIRRNFEVFRHVVFDFHGAYYVAVPLDAPYKPSGPYTRGYSTEDIEDLQLEAHLLANLFTSFEQERIFSRVYSPFLTTRSIKRKLLRQGSKFAHADAFRVYRFRDGAWSEIILGAVMGAARRVEAEKRKRRLAEQLFGSHEPTFSAAGDPVKRARHNESPPVQETTPSAASPPEDTELPDLAVHAAVGGARSGSLASRFARARATPQAGNIAAEPAIAAGEVAPIDPETRSGYGPYAEGRAREIAEEHYRATLPTLRGADDPLERPRRRNRRREDGSTSGETAMGEVVLFAIPGSDAPERLQPAADTSMQKTEPAAPVVAARDAVPDATVPAAPAAGRVEEGRADRIDVVLRRETATFTLPVTAAELPSALFETARSLPSIDAEPETPKVQQLISPSSISATPIKAEEAEEAQTIAAAEAREEDVDEPALFVEPDIDIRIDAISRRFSPPAER